MYTQLVKRSYIIKSKIVPGVLCIMTLKDHLEKKQAVLFEIWTKENKILRALLASMVGTLVVFFLHLDNLLTLLQ